MNDDFTGLENELRALEPVAPSNQLLEQIGTLLGDSTAQRVPVTWWQRLGFNRPLAAFGWGAGSPALTAAIVIVTMHLSGTERLPFPSKIQATREDGNSKLGNPSPPVGADARAVLTASAKATNVLYQALDEGVVLDGAQEPVRRLRYRSADLVEWRNPATGANWEISYPREDVVLVPIRAE